MDNLQKEVEMINVYIDESHTRRKDKSVSPMVDSETSGTSAVNKILMHHISHF